LPPDFADRETAVGLLSQLLARDDIYSVVAESGGRIIGSNFLWENNLIAGVGPITVDPTAQNSTVGRQLMEDVLRRARDRRFAGIRLLQSAYHNRSLSLYTKLGFDAQEPISNLQGPRLGVQIPGLRRPSGQHRRPGRLQLTGVKVHGHDRGPELLEAVRQGTATLVEHGGRITGYASMIGFFGHAVGENNEDVKALIAATNDFAGPGFMVPTRNS
jgi:hypothetical protein